MRVALFTDADVFAGTERHMLDLAVGLRAVGVHPILACPVPSPLAEGAAARQIPVVAIAKRGMMDWRAVRTLVRLLNNGQIDVIHAHNGRTGLSAAIAVSLAGRGAFVATQHFLKPARATRAGMAAALSSAIHRWVGRRAGRLIAVSHAARREMLARRDTPPARITVIPNGIPQTLPPIPLEKAQARRAIGVDEKVPLVLCVARLEPEKDLLSLVRAMGLVVRTIPTAICVVAGEGSQRRLIEQEITAAGLVDRMQLLGFRSDMAALFTACDLFVLPSPAEPFGLVLLEAMSFAKAVVAIQTGGPLEIVVDGETGLLVPPGDLSRLADAIVRLLSDRQLCQAMGERGRHRVEEQFSIDRMARATADVYRQAINYKSVPS